jgi:hypothetical protein
MERASTLGGLTLGDVAGQPAPQNRAPRRFQGRAPALEELSNILAYFKNKFMNCPKNQDTFPYYLHYTENQPCP